MRELAYGKGVIEYGDGSIHALGQLSHLLCAREDDCQKEYEIQDKEERRHMGRGLQTVIH